MITSTNRSLRRSATLLIAASLALASGCDKVTSRLGITGQIGGVAPSPIGPERLRVALPERGVQATLAPVAKNGKTVVWQTLDGITLAFQQGMLVSTRGLGEDLMTSDVSNRLMMLNGQLDGTYYPHIRSYLDGEYQTVFRSYQCQLQAQSREPDINRGNTSAARKLEETCVSPAGEFANTYWIGAAGQVIKSRQWVSPEIGMMETERVQR